MRRPLHSSCKLYQKAWLAFSNRVTCSIGIIFVYILIVGDASQVVPVSLYGCKMLPPKVEETLKLAVFNDQINSSCNFSRVIAVPKSGEMRIVGHVVSKHAKKHSPREEDLNHLYPSNNNSNN